jgi:flagella basal body P-ring formation protein FlgA
VKNSSVFGLLHRALVLALPFALPFALSLPMPAMADAAAAGAPSIDGGVLDQMQELAQRVAERSAMRQARIEIEPGQLDPRLKLAPCTQIEARLPANAPAWGRTRVALRCAEGPAHWQVSLPVTVKVFATAWVADAALPAGTVLQAGHLREAEVDWAAERSPAVGDAAQLIGRSLSRNVGSGDAVRQSDLKPLLWFAAGDTVQVVARGAGFSVSGVALALSPGVAGQRVRVRTESGRVLSGMPIAANRVEVQL